MRLTKKITAMLLVMSLWFSSGIAFADSAAETDVQETEETTSEETVHDYSTEYDIYQAMAQSIVDSYIDDTLTVDDVMKQGLSEYLANNEDGLVALLKSMFEGLDDYSEFFTAAEYQDYINTINKTFYGIGVQLKDVNGYTEIAGFVEGGMAEQSGFKIGDKIVAVNGVDTALKGSDYVRSLIIGELGTTVSISVKRDDEVIELIGTRTEIKQDTVIGGILAGNIGYIKMTSFGSDTANEFSDALNNFRENSVKKIILDLRDNPGGRLDAAVSIAKMIVPEGKIIEVRYRNEEQNTTYYSDLTEAEFQFNVLVNENTASSSEILASAIQDSGVGKLIGKQTYGKAVIQSAVPLINGSVYKLTTGQYITRNGYEINNKGLSPNIEVDNYKEKIDTSAYTSPDLNNRYALGNTADAVKAAKERLYMLGIYSGTVDNGLFDETFMNALMEFQVNNHLSPDGVLDIATQIMLDRLFAKLEKTVDKQLQTAYTMFGGVVDDLY